MNTSNNKEGFFEWQHTATVITDSCKRTDQFVIQNSGKPQMNQFINGIIDIINSTIKPNQTMLSQLPKRSRATRAMQEWQKLISFVANRSINQTTALGTNNPKDSTRAIAYQIAQLINLLMYANQTPIVFEYYQNDIKLPVLWLFEKSTILLKLQEEQRREYIKLRESINTNTMRLKKQLFESNDKYTDKTAVTIIAFIKLIPNQDTKQPQVDINTKQSQTNDNTEPILTQTNAILTQTKPILTQTSSILNKSRDKNPQIPNKKPILTQTKCILTQTKPILTQTNAILSQTNSNHNKPSTRQQNTEQTSIKQVMHDKTNIKHSKLANHAKPIQSKNTHNRPVITNLPNLGIKKMSPKQYNDTKMLPKRHNDTNKITLTNTHITDSSEQHTNETPNPNNDTLHRANSQPNQPTNHRFIKQKLSFQTPIPKELKIETTPRPQYIAEVHQFYKPDTKLPKWQTPLSHHSISQILNMPTTGADTDYNTFILKNSNPNYEQPVRSNNTYDIDKIKHMMDDGKLIPRIIYLLKKAPRCDYSPPDDFSYITYHNPTKLTKPAIPDSIIPTNITYLYDTSIDDRNKKIKLSTSSEHNLLNLILISDSIQLIAKINKKEYPYNQRPWISIYQYINHLLLHNETHARIAMILHDQIGKLQHEREILMQQNNALNHKLEQFDKNTNKNLSDTKLLENKLYTLNNEYKQTLNALKAEEKENTENRDRISISNKQINDLLDEINELKDNIKSYESIKTAIDTSSEFKLDTTPIDPSKYSNLTELLTLMTKEYNTLMIP